MSRLIDDKIIEIEKFFKSSENNKNIDFSKIKDSFKSYNDTVILICPIHGEFEVKYKNLSRKEKSPDHFLCKKCKQQKQLIEYTNNIINTLNELNKERNLDIEFISFIDFDKFKIKLYCRKHDYYWETNYYNLVCNRSIGCSKCNSEYLSKYKTMSNTEAYNRVISANKLYLDNYDFSPVLNSFVNTETPVNVFCKKHNLLYSIDYYTLFNNNSKCGCPKCTLSGISNQEEICFLNILKYKTESLISRQYEIKIDSDFFKSIRTKIYVDFYISELNTIIEYDGRQHYELVKKFHKSYQDFVNQINRDRCLEQYCKENNIKLLQISYKDNNRIPEIIKIFFEEGKDITTKVEPKLLPVLYHG